MKYWGRFVLLFLAIVTAWINILFGNVEVGPFTLFTGIHVVFSWFIGSWYDKYRYLSYHDPLTGVYNRMYAYIHFEKRLKRAKRRNESIGFLYIDLDDFKLINDTYGHSHGDFVLKELCKVIAGTIRKDDILVRWGGDESLLLLIDNDNSSVQHQINQITETIKTEVKKPDIILSIGHSIYPKDEQNALDLILFADKRTWKVKSKTKEASNLWNIYKYTIL